eukprot:TRINITY_DN2518_c0_g1_i1.p1 TRINITY_DN2518_c0_g1~~TRINITY_DN2518_c0_g1_i1.p1  ORF type:complete len:164 (+),score=10.52 TRINITY_DN2518_c0_g1_i1:50-493(+)
MSEAVAAGEGVVPVSPAPATAQLETAVAVAHVVSLAELQRWQAVAPLDGVSVRCLGRLHSVASGSAHQVQFGFEGAVVEVDVSLLEEMWTSVRPDVLYVLVGEVYQTRNEFGIRARLIQNVNTLDVALYREALQLLRDEQGLTYPFQ